MPIRRIATALAAATLLGAGHAWAGAGQTPSDIAARSAGADMEPLATDVAALADLARTHIETVGLDRALSDFSAPPWTREANGLHLWGVTMSGMSWFDAGHPGLVGLDVSGMTDLTGVFWSDSAVRSATGDGAAMFGLLYPHPRSERAARGLHTCFLLDDGQRVLCAGAFEDH